MNVKTVIINILKIIRNIFAWLIFDLTGIRIIISKAAPGIDRLYRKFLYNSKPSSLIFIIAGLYFILFFTASQRYENRINLIEYRVNSIIQQLSITLDQNTKINNKAIERIGVIQNMKCPIKPLIFNPVSIFRSITDKPVLYDDGIILLKDVVEDYCRDLKSVHLKDAILNNCNFSYTNLNQAYISNSNLEKVNFRISFLENNVFSFTNLSRSVFFQCNLKGSTFSNCNLQKSNFDSVNLENCIFFKCILKNSNFNTVNFKNTGFEDCDLREIKFGNTPDSSTKKYIELSEEQKQAVIDNFSEIKFLKNILLDIELKKDLMEKAPHLFTDLFIKDVI